MLYVTPEALLAGGAGLAAITAQQGAATAAAMPVVSALIPSGVDTVSVLASHLFSTEGVDFSARSAEGATLLGMAAEGMTAVGAAYQAVDTAGAVQVL
jgi:hypothetical protein